MGTIPRRLRRPQDIQPIFDAIDDGPLIAQLNDYRWTGRKGYTPVSMWRAILLKYLLRLRYVRDLIAQLAASRPLRRLCGFRDAVPSESTFSRFLSRLSQHQHLVNRAITSASAGIGDTLARLKDAGQVPDKAPAHGRAVAIDSTDIPAYGNPQGEHPADPDARWGHRTPKAGDTGAGADKFYGFKLHALCDAYYGTPLSWEVLPANANDYPQLAPLMDQLAVDFPQMPTRYLLADRGYDGLSNYRYLDDRRILAVIHMRDTGRGQGIIDVRGRPFCMGGVPMQYIRTDCGKGHLFRCNPDKEDCPLKNTAPWLGSRCNTEYHENWDGDHLRRVGRFARASKRWRRLYRRRPIIERMFSSMKRSRLLAEHSCLGIVKVRLHVSLSLLTYTGSMLARLLAGDYEGMLRMGVRRPSQTWALAA